MVSRYSHNRARRQKCCSEDESFGSSPCFVAQEGDHFQRHRKEHKEWKAENSHGHYFEHCVLVLVTCAVIRCLIVFGSANENTFPFHFHLFNRRSCSQWMSQTLHPHLPLRTPMNATLCWSFHVTHILASSWRRYLMMRTHVTKMRFIVLKVIPIGIIPDTQIRLSDGCSGLMLFLSQRVCQALHTTEVSSACGYELYFLVCPLQLGCTCCSMDPKAWQHLQSGHLITLYTDDYVCNFLREDRVISAGTRPDVHNVARGPDPQRSLECFTHVMIDDSRIFPRSVLQADTIVVSYGQANFERISWSTQRCHKFGNCAMDQLQRPTTTSFSKVSRTTTLEGATVVQYG